MGFKSLSAVVAASVTSMVALNFAFTAPAEGGVGGTCDQPYFCLYENVEFNKDNTDNWRSFKESKRHLSDFNWKFLVTETRDNMNDEASSIKNRSGQYVCLYQDANFGGAKDLFGPGANIEYLSKENIGDNEASSIRFRGTRAYC